MDAIDHRKAEREAQRVQAYHEELVERIAWAIPEDGIIQPIQGLHLGRLSSPMGTVHGVLEPSFCVIAQGSKEVLTGDSRYFYDPLHYLLATVELPCAFNVREASKERPYLTFRLEISPSLVSSAMVEASYVSSQDGADSRAIDVSLLDVNLLDAVVRFIRLLDSPAEARVLLPLITKEIIHRLLLGDQGSRLSHLAVPVGYAPDIVKAIKRLRQDFNQPIRVELLASELGMSVSRFHHHFKAVTGMSPLQFQKHLRLQEARRLMLSENLDATSVAHRVGYNDASHFNREYKSIFGIPPMRDVQQLRETTGTVAS